MCACVCVRVRACACLLACVCAGSFCYAVGTCEQFIELHEQHDIRSELNGMTGRMQGAAQSGTVYQNLKRFNSTVYCMKSSPASQSQRVTSLSFTKIAPKSGFEMHFAIGSQHCYRCWGHNMSRIQNQKAKTP